MSSGLLSPREAALAGLLHDIGKLAQRAHPDEQALRAAYRDQDLEGLQASILPSKHGRYTHRHALWTDFFFEWAEREQVPWPGGINLTNVRRAAIRHHNPADPADWIVAEADRLASGLERKEKDEAHEYGDANHPQGLREVELHALVTLIDIGVGPAPSLPLRHGAEEISAEALLPRPPTPSDQPRRFGILWDSWLNAWAGFARQGELPADRFEQAALALSVRLLWAVPSSTRDQPDVSLHDHAHAVAAIAAALAAFHAAAGEASESAIRNRTEPKFRLVALDLSGIQDALFRLAGSAGAARILRARSFLMAEMVAVAVLAVREQLRLPAASVLLAAGGKAELLAAALDDLDDRLAEVRETLDRWLIEHWQGDLALNLAAGEPFAATAFEKQGEGFPAVRADLAARLDAAKHRPFSGWRACDQGFVGTGVIETQYQAEGACVTCGARPAVVTTLLDGGARCIVCDSTYRLGQRLPKSDGFAIADAEQVAGEADALQADQRIPLPFGLVLLPWPARGSSVRRSVIFEGRGEIGTAVPRVTAHVPVIDDPDAPHYRKLGLQETESGSPSARGDLMTFGHIAAEALERNKENGFRGRALLGIIKADVDRLGRIFACGLKKDRSPARIAQLSRLIDSYFARRLPWLLRHEFPATYTVYAGGDDLLLVSPWRFAMPLAVRLREDFGTFAGGNPNLSLSAGVAFVHPHHPISLAVAEADEMLERAKKGGRDRLGVFDRVLTWREAEATLHLAEDLHQAVVDEMLPPTFLHRMRRFAALRQRVETQGGHADPGWAAKWAYHKARFLDRAGNKAKAPLQPLLDRAVPPPAAASEADPEIAMTIALWRNR